MVSRNYPKRQQKGSTVFWLYCLGLNYSKSLFIMLLNIFEVCHFLMFKPQKSSFKNLSGYLGKIKFIYHIY